VTLAFAISALMTSLSAVLIAFSVFRYLAGKHTREHRAWLQTIAKDGTDQAWEEFEVHTKRDFEQSYHDYTRRQ